MTGGVSGVVGSEAIAGRIYCRISCVSCPDTDFPFPIPLVRMNGTWRFDAACGRLEILYRRIGRNELDAMQACLRQPARVTASAANVFRFTAITTGA